MESGWFKGQCVTVFGNLPFIDAIWAVAPTAIRMGLRSEIGLAVTKFPPMDWGEGEGR